MDARALLADVVRSELPPLEPAMALKRIPKLDSLAMVNLVLKLESLLRRELTEDEIETLRTVADVEQLLEGA